MNDHAAVEEARKALKPFSTLAENIDHVVQDSAMVVLTNLNGGIIDTGNRISVGDLRRAREAYIALGGK